MKPRPELLLVTCTLAACRGGDSVSGPSGAHLDGTWRFSATFADSARTCTQAGTLTLRETGRGSGLAAFPQFEGSLMVVTCSCADLYCTSPGLASRVIGTFYGNSYFGAYGSMNAGLDVFAPQCDYGIDPAEINRMSGTAECRFGPWLPQPSWAAKGTWVAERN